MDYALDQASLRAEYARLRRIYSNAVECLFTVGYRMTDTEHRWLRNEVEETRVQSEIAWLKLGQHDIPAQSKAS